MEKVRLFFLSWIILIQGCGQPNDQQLLLATIQSTNQHLMIENGDHFVWENPVITLNDEYYYHIDYVPRGKISIAYHAFKNEDGHTFEPGLLKVRKVEIRVSRLNDEKDLTYTW
ncbi:hypothetical protein V1503_01315 [Bacillus sp. SCS-151]|uniref:hypothetical protein n=1 Tax=Nanhaiella sioensis TaxID=3115293 RepID=UPI00397CDFEA